VLQSDLQHALFISAGNWGIGKNREKYQQVIKFTKTFTEIINRIILNHIENNVDSAPFLFITNGFSDLLKYSAIFTKYFNIKWCQRA